MGHAKHGSGTARGTSAVLIAGPTASGKSALAMALAERHGGVVINADSMQVYRDLRIITARPSVADEARVPHRLYGHVDAAENYSVGRWCQDAAAALDEIKRAGRLPILVGGTGLYFKALTEGLSAVPPTPPDIRAAVRARCDAEGAEALHAELAAAIRRWARGSSPPTGCGLPGARSAGGDRAFAIGLASRRHAGDPRSRTRR